MDVAIGSGVAAHLAGGAVGPHVGHDAVLAEAPDARAQNPGAHERRAAAGHVHVARAGKVDDAHRAREHHGGNAAAALNPERRQPALHAHSMLAPSVWPLHACFTGSCVYGRPSQIYCTASDVKYMLSKREGVHE